MSVEEQEQQRLASLHGLNILETPLERHFDHITALASRLFGGAQAAIVFVDHDRVWAKSTEQGTQCEYSRSQSLCGNAVDLGKNLELCDASQDPRFLNLGAITSVGIRFYANRLLRSDKGHIVGSLCVRDTMPRELSDDDRCNLDLLGAMANELVADVELKGRGRPYVSSGTELEELSGLDFRTIFHESMESMSLLSYPELRYVDLNGATEDLLGRPRSIVLGTRFGESTDGFATGEFSKILEGLSRQGKAGPLEIRFRNARQEPKIAVVSAQLVNSGDSKPLALFVTQDITVSKHREESLKLLFQGTARDQGPTFLKSACAVLAKVTDVDFVMISRPLDGGTKLNVIECFHNGEFAEPFVMEQPPSPCLRVLGGESVFIPQGLIKEAPECPIAAHQGAVAFLGIPILSKANEVIGILAVMAKKPLQADSERQLMLGILADRIASDFAQMDLLMTEKLRAEELETARSDAERASRAKGDFLARMSHELRTPMNAIMGFSRLLTAEPDTTPKQLETLSIINRSGEHLLAMINDVLEMSKIEAGLAELRSRPLSLHSLIDDIAQMFCLRAEANELDLIVTKQPDLPDWIESDCLKLRQVLTNLLGNAMKFTKRGSVELAVGFEESRLHFTVRDTGIGIEPHDLANLFEAFSQAESGRNSEEGTGLGLAISEAFVTLLGGKISAKSTPNVGTEFSFWIPHQVALPTVESQRPVTVESVSGLRDSSKPLILVVDDQRPNRLVISTLLTRVGFRVIEATDGVEALQQAQNALPNLILMDVRMPKMNGLEATKAIRNLGGQYREIGIFALTGNAFDEDRQAAHQAGCTRFLSKPIDLDELLATVGEELGIQYKFRSDKVPA